MSPPVEARAEDEDVRWLRERGADAKGKMWHDAAERYERIAARLVASPSDQRDALPEQGWMVGEPLTQAQFDWVKAARQLVASPPDQRDAPFRLSEQERHRIRERWAQTVVERGQPAALEMAVEALLRMSDIIADMRAATEASEASSKYATDPNGPRGGQRNV